MPRPAKPARHNVASWGNRLAAPPPTRGADPPAHARQGLPCRPRRRM